MNHFMKRSLALALAFLMTFSLCACGGTNAPDEQKKPAQSNQAGADLTKPDKVYVARVTTTNSKESFLGQALEYLFDSIEEKTNGQIKPEYYFSGVLGEKQANMEGMRAHTVTAGAVSETDLAIYSPGWSVFSLPYVFGGSLETELACYQDEEFFEFLDSTLEKSGLKLMVFFTAGFRNPLNSLHAIRTPEDAKGIRLRVVQNEYLAKTYELMGFTPVSLGWSEVYSAMQQGVVDGAENSAALLLDNQLTDFGKYYSIINALIGSEAIVMDRQFYDDLPDDLRAAVDEACKEAMAKEWSEFVAYNDSAQQTMIDKGVEVTELTEEEINVFIGCISSLKDTMFSETPETEEFYNQIQAAIERVK